MSSLTTATRRRFFIVSIVTAVFVACQLYTLVGSTHAAVFAKYDGIDGEAKDDKHDKWIDVLAIDWGALQPTGEATGHARPQGSVRVDGALDLTLTQTNNSSFRSVTVGQHFDKVELHSVAPSSDGRVTYYAYELKNVQVTSVSLQSDPTGNNFEEVEFTYDQGNGARLSYDDSPGPPTLEDSYSFRLQDQVLYYDHQPEFLHPRTTVDDLVYSSVRGTPLFDIDNDCDDVCDDSDLRVSGIGSSGLDGVSVHPANPVSLSEMRLSLRAEQNNGNPSSLRVAATTDRGAIDRADLTAIFEVDENGTDSTRLSAGYCSDGSCSSYPVSVSQGGQLLFSGDLLASEFVHLDGTTSDGVELTARKKRGNIEYSWKIEEGQAIVVGGGGPISVDPAIPLEVRLTSPHASSSSLHAVEVYGSNLSQLVFEDGSFSAVPEPSSMALLMVCLGFVVRPLRR